MKLIQIFALVAALAANAAAQTSGQSTDPAAPSTAKPQPQHQAATSTDPKKKDSPKNSAASKNTAGSSGQTGGIKVIVPPKSASQTAPAAGAKAPAGTKPATQPAASKSSTPATGNAATTNTKKTTGVTTGKSPQPAGAASPTGTAQGSKATSHPAAGQNKQTPPVLAVNPSSKQTKSASTRKGAGKMIQPRIVQRTPSKANIVAAAKTSAKISSAGRRDPFVSPIRNVSVGAAPVVLNCSTGKRGLAIGELTVQGTAKDTDGKMMAIVASGNHRAYFLRENDQICNGGVQKITADSVIFRESVTDNLGRQTTHEVVKKINPS
ncbi:MAG TPA: hypothetical protein VG488_06055 [Candidatus Angelobacter sp.]|jgi:hypothetical protein|nr:hypothetical protein [Candidatus Angelobacter sp.]